MLNIGFTIIIPFLVAAIIPLIYRKLSKLHIGWIVATVPLTLFIIFIQYLPKIVRGKTITSSYDWIPSFDVSFLTHLDGLGMIFSLIITGMGVLVVIYSIYYLSQEESLKHFYIYLLLFMGGMLGVVLTDHLLTLYLFWEVTSVSSFLLIAFWYQRKGSRYGARKALLITIFGGIAMLAGFLMIYQATGTFNIQEIITKASVIKEHSLFIPAMVLILLGAFTKSAQFPFHIWLPDAMEAPTPISAYLHSATMVKAGIYLVARFTPLFAGDQIWFWLISGVGLFTLFWASFTAIRQSDLKALLAYSTVSQLGLIMSLLGVGSIAFYNGVIQVNYYTQAVFAALFHLINHATFKGALFMVIGIIDFQLGTRDLRRLGGLITLMPFSFTIALIGSFSMAGLPPFNGFLSKEMFFTAMLHVTNTDVFSLEAWGVLFPVIAWSASVLTFVYCLIIVIKTFFGESQQEFTEDSYEAPAGMLAAPLILSALVVIIFFFPNVIGKYLITPAMASIFSPILANHSLQETISIWHGFNTELFMTFGIIALGTIIFIFLKYWKYIYRLFPKKYSIDALYNYGIDTIESSSNKITRFYMTGHLRHYLIYIYVVFIGSVGGLLVYKNIFTFSIAGDAPIGTFEWIISFVIIIAASMVLFTKSRLPAILLTGVVGFSVAVFYVLFRAPDLALTQVVIETATTVLFLLCFYFLPDWQEKKEKNTHSKVNVLISVGVGLTFTLIALSVHNGNLFTSISSYFEDALELTGARNIVNTILGDFRAFDTMLEVIVLFIAGLGVYSLIKIRSRKEAENIED